MRRDHEHVLLPTTVVLCLLALPGCMTMPMRKVSQGELSQIHVGTTTEGDVVALLGKPTSRHEFPDGRKLLVYAYWKMKHTRGSPDLAGAIGGGAAAGAVSGGVGVGAIVGGGLELLAPSNPGTYTMTDSEQVGIMFRPSGVAEWISADTPYTKQFKNKEDSKQRTE